MEDTQFVWAIWYPSRKIVYFVDEEGTEVGELSSGSTFHGTFTEIARYLQQVHVEWILMGFSVVGVR